MPANSFGSDQDNQAGSAEGAKRFERTRDLFGVEQFAKIRDSRIAVIGLGGVGSHAALALARSGVGELLLVDFDRVTASSLNRSPFAGPQDLGRYKVEVAQEALALTCPDTQINVRREFCHEETLDELLVPEPDGIVDAIDSLNPKVTLLAYCAWRKLPTFSSMGASARRDSTKVRTGDITDTEVCPLARQVRKMLRRRGVDSGITCVYSVEVPSPPLPPDLEDWSYDRGRIRNRLPSQMSLPGIFGYTLAALVLDHLGRGNAVRSNGV
jgi:tRNA A37 threonylcarbamoyladenosine dehydratase